MPSRPSPEKVQTAGKVLAKIKAYDQSMSNPGEGIILAWASALTLANIAEDVALDAVDHMYLEAKTLDFRPLPGLLIHHCREIRRERFELERRSREEAEAALEEQKISLQEWEERHSEKFPKFETIGKVLDFRDPKVESANLRRVACPHCKVPIGAPCVIAGSSQPLTKQPVHWSRLEAAKKAGLLT